MIINFVKNFLIPCFIFELSIFVRLPDEIKESIKESVKIKESRGAFHSSEKGYEIFLEQKEN